MDLTTFDFSKLAPLTDRKTGADLITRHFGVPISARTLESKSWELDWRIVNGKALCAVTQLFAVAQAKLDAAPPARTARRQAA